MKKTNFSLPRKFNPFEPLNLNGQGHHILNITRFGTKKHYK